nr:sugar dehydrogenase complex small subunit [uncultured Neokomagataea sp.]
MVDRGDFSLLKEVALPRRRVLQVMGAAITTALLNEVTPAHAGEVLNNTFFQLSQQVTGCSTLDRIISQRLLTALQSIFPHYEQEIHDLVVYINNNDTPEKILQEAEKIGKVDTVHNLIAAWYIGSATRHMNAPMVAYYDALMYHPTRDALPVPTYCFAEPGWWTQDPPPLGIPVHSSKVITPPAPPPVAVEAKPAPAVPLKPHRPSHYKGHQ